MEDIIMTNQEKIFDGKSWKLGDLITKSKSVAILDCKPIDVAGVVRLSNNHPVVMVKSLMTDDFWNVKLYNVTEIGDTIVCTSQYGSTVVGPTIVDCIKEFNTDYTVASIEHVDFLDGSEWNIRYQSSRTIVWC